MNLEVFTLFMPWIWMSPQKACRLNCSIVHMLNCSVCNCADCMDHSPPGSSVHGDSPGKYIGMSCHALLQGIFPNQGLNPYLLGLLFWQAESLPLSHLGMPKAEKKILGNTNIKEGSSGCKRGRLEQYEEN